MPLFKLTLIVSNFQSNEIRENSNNTEYSMLKATEAVYCATYRKLMVVIILSNLVLATSALAQCISSEYPFESYCYYASTYPDRGQPHWGNHDWAANGITHDDSNWYFSTHNRDFLGKTKATDFALYRIPVKYDINNFSMNQPGVVKFQLSQVLPENSYLRRNGYGHIGDIDYCEYDGIGYIIAPLTAKGQPPVIAFFRAADLSYIHYAKVNEEQKGAGWCASFDSDYLYTSSNHTDRILRYKINWQRIMNKSSESGIAFDTSFTLKSVNNKTITLRNMQGGAFSPSGMLLYVTCGVLFCDVLVNDDKGEVNPEDGIHVFKRDERKDWTQVFRSSNSKMRPENVDLFDFRFNNNTCSADEPEGITIWDVDNLKTNSDEKIRGHLHVILDNHNKYQLLRNIANSAKWANPLLYIQYKSITRVFSFFKRSKVHTSKVSVQHFGPYPYDYDKGETIDGGRLLAQNKKDIMLLDMAFEYLQNGDTLGMMHYLVENIDSTGYPKQHIGRSRAKNRSISSPHPPPTNPFKPKATTALTVDCVERAILIKSDDTRTRFGYDAIVNRKNRCVFSGKKERSIGIHLSSHEYNPKGRVLQLAFQGRGVKSKKTHFPYGVKNDIGKWKNSLEDLTNEFSFVMVGVSEHGVSVASAKGNRVLPGISPSLFEDSRSELLENLATAYYLDRDFSILRYPIEKRPRVLLHGQYNSDEFMVGIDEWGDTYFPVDLPENSSKLLRILVKGSQLSSPLNSLIDDWYKGHEARSIVACIEQGHPGIYKSPEDAWSGSRQFSGQFTKDLTFLLNDGEILGKQLPQEVKSEFYNEVRHLQNVYLTIIAINDPMTKLLDSRGSKLALISGNPDDVYFLDVPQNNGKPKITALFSSESARNKISEAEKVAYLAYMKKDGSVHPNLEVYIQNALAN